MTKPSKAKIARLSFVRPNVITLMFQKEGEEVLEEIEISKGQLRGILVDGASLALQQWDEQLSSH